MTKSPDYAQPNIPALQLKGLSKTYHNGFTALKGIDLTVPQGSFLRYLVLMERANQPPSVLSALYFPLLLGL